eukprot:5141890-Amphidinium_carterae.1
MSAFTSACKCLGVPPHHNEDESIGQASESKVTPPMCKRCKRVKETSRMTLRAAFKACALMPSCPAGEQRSRFAVTHYAAKSFCQSIVRT